MKSSQEYFGSSFDLKSGLESQDQGITAEEMFSSPIKLGTDVPMAGEDQFEICFLCRNTRPENQPADQEKIEWVGCEKCENWYHILCVGFKNQSEVDNIDYICQNCSKAGELSKGNSFMASQQPDLE